MIKKKISFFLLLTALNCSGQTDYMVKLMSWNVLNWPSTSNLVSDTTLRCPAYRSVVNYVNPDILVTTENTSNDSPILFLNQVMNTGPYHYASGTFINGYDTDNAIYYRDSLFDFISNVPIHTALRDISQFTLVFKQTGDTIHIFSCHLKASQGFEHNRELEVSKLRSVTNSLPTGSNFLVCGDFNIYSSGEPAYTAMLADYPTNDGNFLDALNLVGTWNNPAYAPYHTQSTRVSSSTGGSGGGMNDRFDMILYSNGVAEPSGVYFVPGSYMNIGNDGYHYDRDINYGTNSAVPSVVANALYDASDHLPVILTLEIGPLSAINDPINKLAEVNVFPQPVSEQSVVKINLKQKSNVQYYFTDPIGRLIDNSETMIYGPGEYYLPVDWNKLGNQGIYFLCLTINNTLISRKIIAIK